MSELRHDPGERYLSLLVRLYPPVFRERFGEEMIALAIRSVRSRVGVLRWTAWIRVTLDLARGGLLERIGSRPKLWQSTRKKGGRGTDAWDHDGLHEPPRRRMSRDRETMMETLRHDIRSTLRRVFRTPWFSLAAVAIVALGIGANTAVFTVVNAIMLRPPPFAEPDRVVRVYQDSDDGDPNSSSFPAYRDMTSFGDVFASVSASTPDDVNWERPEGPEPALVEYVTASLMDVVGLSPALGRWFEPAHDRVGAGYYAVVSYHTWRTRMGADPDVLGSVVRLDGRPVTVIGVGPEGFNSGQGSIFTDFWLSISSVEVGGSFRVANLDRREDHWYEVLARLQPGVTVSQAQAAMDALALRLGEEYPELDAGRDITVFRAADVRVHPQVDHALAPVGAILLGIAGIVLLLACSNLANLLLVQGIARSSEVAVRRALGATRARVARLFLGEAFVLATVGGGVGVLLARWALGYAGRLPDVLPIQGEVDLSMDVRVLIFTLILVLVSASFFGLAPAVRSARFDPGRELRSETRSASVTRGASLLQGGLVAVQVAASVVLLVSAGLLVRSLANLERVDPGFETAGLAYVGTTTNVPGLDQNSSLLLERVREGVQSRPGVLGAALTSRLPVSFGGSTTQVVEGYDPPSGTGSVELDFASVSDNYFDVMGLPIVDGRGFDPDDGPGQEPVVIVNEAAVRRFWGGGDALAGRIRSQSAPDSWRRVVGVVADHKVEALGESPVPMIYYPAGRNGLASGYIVARGSGAAADLLPLLRTELARVSPALPMSALNTMEGRLGDALRTPRLTAALLGGFALVALLLASLGVYSVVSFSVARRTAEFGIRVALGAGRGRLVASAVLRMLATVVVGVIVGVGLSFLAAPMLGGMLFGIPALDPASFAGAALLLTVLAGAAAWIPARRAAQANPVDSLRAR